MEQQAAGQGLWIVGGKFSIADISCFSWINWAGWAGVETSSFKELEAWLKAIEDRPAVQKGLNVPDKFELKEKLKNEKTANEYAKQNSNWIVQDMKEQAEKHK